jgi:hypothetical protein
VESKNAECHEADKNKRAVQIHGVPRSLPMLGTVSAKWSRALSQIAVSETLAGGEDRCLTDLALSCEPQRLRGSL